MTMDGATAQEIIRQLGLQRHPEGGHFRETFRDPCSGQAGRAASTAIYYLLGRGELSAWHRVDAAEIWHFYAGAPLKIGVQATAQGTVVTWGDDSILLVGITAVQPGDLLI